MAGRGGRLTFDIGLSIPSGKSFVVTALGVVPPATVHLAAAAELRTTC